MSLRVTDVFPKVPSNKPLIKLTKYPEKNFTYWKYKTLPTGERMKIFIYFMTGENRVYYLKKHPSHKTDSAVLQIGKGCQKFDRGSFNPTKIDFRSVKGRLRKDLTEENRTNADTRMGFKIGNQYLVKCYFTSGIRTVERGTAHVVQTLRVPVLLYLKPKPSTSKYFQSDDPKKDEKVFPYERLHTYKLSILPPYTANRIPPGTRYVLLTVQKTYFTFDMVPENYQIPFKYRDPVKQKITKLAGCGNDYLDKPIKTPYIEHVPSDPEEDNEQQITFPQEQQQQIIFPQNVEQNVVFTTTTIPMQNDVQQNFEQLEEQQPMQDEQTFMTTPMQQNVEPMQDEQTFMTTPMQDEQTFMTMQQNVEQPMQQNEQTDPLLTQQQQQLTFWLVPSTQEKSVVRVSVDFAETYRRLKESNRLESEPRMKIPISYNNYEEPLDLSSSSSSFSKTDEPPSDAAAEIITLVEEGQDIVQQAMNEEIFKDCDDELMRELDNFFGQNF